MFRAAAILADVAGLTGAAAGAGSLAGAPGHSRQVTRSYRPGLFHC